MSQSKRINRVAPKEPEPKENRDPNNINDHIRVDFYSVLAEPSTGPRSIDCTWECSEIFYNCCLECWYKLFSLLFGICIAIYWGLQFVPVLFTNIWLFTPFRQFFWMSCGHFCKSVWTMCLRCAVKPCARSCGHLFINCGDGTINRSETPPPPRKPRKAPQQKQEEKSKEVVPNTKEPDAVAGDWDGYDKDKIKNSVKRTMLFY